MGERASVITLLLTDVEGSTPLWDREPAAMAVAMVRHDEIVAAVVGAHGGEVVKARGEGDSAFCVLPGPAEGLAAAAELQLAIAAEEWGTTRPLRVRCALHTGPAELRDGDWFGVTVIRCARLRSYAAGAQVICTDVVAAAGPPDRCSLRRIGTVTLRGLTDPVEVHQLMHPEFGGGDVTLDGPDATPILPVRPTALGRDYEVRSIVKILVDGSDRLVTLLGTGGVGKTTVALAAAHELADALGGRVWWVDLQAVSRAEEVVPVIAAAVGADTGAGVDGVVARLGQGEAVLVIDNVEQVVECRDDLNALLRAVPRLRMLCTSRVRLRTENEVVVPIGPLDVPTEADGAAGVLDSPAVGVLVTAARAAGSPPPTSEAEMAAVGEVARSLDGVALALRLAGARVRTLGYVGLADRLRAGGTAALRDRALGTERHRSLEAALSWSWDLLDEDERAVFVGLACCPGGATVPLLTALRGEGDEDDVDEIVERLVDASLVEVDDTAGAARFHQLVPVREFALGRLDADRLAEARERLVLWLAQVLETPDNLQLESADATPYVRRADAERLNLTAALRWITDGDVPLAVGQRLFHSAGGLLCTRRGSAEVADAAEALLRSAGPEDRFRYLWYASKATLIRDSERSIPLHREMIAARLASGAKGAAAQELYVLAQMLGPDEDRAAYAEALELTDDDELRAMILVNLGVCDGWRGDLEAAFGRYEAAQQLGIASDSPLPASFAAGNAAGLLIEIGAPARAAPLLEKAVALVPSDNTWGRPMALRSAGVRELLLGNSDRARARIAEALEFCEQHGQPVVVELLTLAVIELLVGDPAAAQRIVMRVRSMTDTAVFLAEADQIDGLVRLRTGRFGEAADLLRSAVDRTPDGTWTYSSLSGALVGLALASTATGASAEATRAAARALAIAVRVGRAAYLADALEVSAAALAPVDPERAALLLGASRRPAQAVSYMPRIRPDVPALERALATAIGATRLNELLRDGSEIGRGPELLALAAGTDHSKR